MEKKYLGENAVKNIVDTDGMSEVEFENGKKEMIPTFFLNQLLSDNSVPYPDFMNSRANIIVPEMLAVLLKYNIKLAEIDRILEKFVLTYDQNMESARTILFGKNKEDRTFLDINNILLSERKTLGDILTGKK